MTIATKLEDPEKTNIENQKIPSEENEKFKLFSSDIPMKGKEPWYKGVVSNRYIDWRGKRLLASLCLTLFILWVLMATVFGSILLFRYFSHKPTFFGSCVVDVPQHNVHSLKLWQQVEVDSENEVEKLKIPSFGPNRPALIIHDFRKNVTIITDLTGRRCFLKPLDEHIAPPANLIDLVRKFERGYYEPDIKVLREDYEVSSAPLTEEELNESPPFLFKEIKSFPVYWLKSTKPKNRYRRSRSCESGKYLFFNGADSVIETNINFCK